MYNSTLVLCPLEMECLYTYRYLGTQSNKKNTFFRDQVLGIIQYLSLMFINSEN